jgi:hypothetical protein
VSVCWRSLGETAWVTPDSPPIVNMATRATANFIAVANVSLPPQSVASQLKIFTPVGTAMNIVDTLNAATETGPMPEANMWWAHTPQPMKPMAMPENTMNGEPKSGLRLKTGMISEMIPNAGRIRMYTSGCPKTQNKFSQSSGSAPASTLKKFASYSRSKVSRNSATVMTGMAKAMRNWVTNPIQVKIGILNNVMPGARRLSTVTMRLMAPRVEATPVIRRPSE